MQFELPFFSVRVREPVPGFLLAGSRAVQLQVVRNRRARRYILRLRPDGTARVTVPRGGSELEARRFAEKQTHWLEKQLLRQASSPMRPRAWFPGTEIWFRGESVGLELGNNGEGDRLRFGTEWLRISDIGADLRPEVEGYLRHLAERELPELVFELAARHQLKVQRVRVGNQRSRWGSCSRRGTVSLNWRLVQTPFFVRDYIVLHELAHLKEMNHSRRFWREVARLCPEFERAEKWLKEHSRKLL